MTLQELSPDEISKLNDEVTQAIQSENSLINNRLTWMGLLKVFVRHNGP